MEMGKNFENPKLINRDFSTKSVPSEFSLLGTKKNQKKNQGNPLLTNITLTAG